MTLGDDKMDVGGDAAQPVASAGTSKTEEEAVKAEAEAGSLVEDAASKQVDVATGVEDEEDILNTMG